MNLTRRIVPITLTIENIKELNLFKSAIEAAIKDPNTIRRYDGELLSYLEEILSFLDDSAILSYTSCKYQEDIPF